MIAEAREQEERGQRQKDNSVYDVPQKMQAYLRDKFSYDSVKGNVQGVEDMLKVVGADWLLARGRKPDANELGKQAKEAVELFLSNWKGKEHGEDARGGNRFAQLNDF